MPRATADPLIWNTNSLEVIFCLSQSGAYASAGVCFLGFNFLQRKAFVLLSTRCLCLCLRRRLLHQATWVSRKIDPNNTRSCVIEVCGWELRVLLSHVPPSALLGCSLRYQVASLAHVSSCIWDRLGATRTLCPVSKIIPLLNI